MKLFISGHSGSGKSTAIYRILQELQEPFYGFWTKKYFKNFDGAAPVYLHNCRKPLCFSKENQVGLCIDRGTECYPKVFDTLGVAALKDIPEGSLVLLDELGFMENQALQFQKQVLELLNGNYRVIAAMKDRSTPFLDSVRCHPQVVVKNAEEAKSKEFFAYALNLLKK